MIAKSDHCRDFSLRFTASGQCIVLLLEHGILELSKTSVTIGKSCSMRGGPRIMVKLNQSDRMEC